MSLLAKLFILTLDIVDSLQLSHVHKHVFTHLCSRRIFARRSAVMAAHGMQLEREKKQENERNVVLCHTNAPEWCHVMLYHLQKQEKKGTGTK